ncbi:MAG: aa3-type cytochrome c oxidase subunit IV [Bauldia sp.]
MAEHGAAQIGTAAGTEYAEHERTYRGFLRLVKYSIAGIVVILVLMATFLT